MAVTNISTRAQICSIGTNIFVSIHTLNVSSETLLITSIPKTEEPHHFRLMKKSEERTSTSKGEYNEKYTVNY